MRAFECSSGLAWLSVWMLALLCAVAPVHADTYERIEHNIRFDAPEGWVPRPTRDEGIVLDLSNITGSERIYITADQWPELTYDDALDRIRQELDDPFSIRAVESATVAGLPGRLVTGRQRAGRDWVRHWVYVLLHGQGVYKVHVIVSHADKERALRLLENAALGFQLADLAADPPAVGEQAPEPVRRHVDAVAGFELALGERWWAGLGNGERDERALFQTVHSSGARLAVYAFCAPEGVAPAALEAALLAGIRLEPDSPDMTGIERGDDTLDAAYSLTGLDGVDVYGRVHLVTGDRCAWLVDVWGGTRAAVRERMTDVTLGLRVDEAAIRPDALDPATQAFFINEAGLFLFAEKRYAPAADLFVAANELKPDREVLTNALSALNFSDQYARARVLLDRQSIERDDTELLSWSAWIDYHRGARDAAVETYEILFNIDGYRNDEDLTAYLRALAALGQFDEAHAAYAAYGSNPPSDELRQAALDVYIQQGDVPAALAAADAYVDAAPFNVGRALVRLRALDRLSEHERLVAGAQALIDAGHAGSGTYYWLGVGLTKLRRYQAAQEAIEAALRFDPADEELLDYQRYLAGELGTGGQLSYRDHIPFVQPPATVLKAAAQVDEVPAEGADAVFVYRIISHDYQPGRYRRYSEHGRVRVLSLGGLRQYGTLEFAYDPTLYRAFVNRIEVWDGGRIVARGQLQDAYYADSTNGDQADFLRTLYIPVPGLKPGRELEFVVTMETLGDGSHFPIKRAYLSLGEPVGYSAVTLAGDLAALDHNAFGVGVREDGDALVWDLFDPPVIDDEPYQQVYDRYLPWVMFGSTDADWASVAHDYLAMVDDKLGRRDEVQGLLAGLAEAPPGAVTDALVHAIRGELTYKAIEFGSRGLIPQTPAESLARRYGDCKDHAVLLQTALEAAGVPAVLALINIDESVVPTLPSLNQFDHMIVYLPGEQRFIDPTDKYLDPTISPPAGLAGRHALLLDREDPRLVQLGEYAAEHSAIRSDRTLTIGESATIRLSEAITFSGYPAASMRSSLTDIEPAGMADALQNWVTRNLGRVRLRHHAVRNLDDPKQPLVIEVDYEVVGQKPIVTGDGMSLYLRGIAEPNYLDIAASSRRVSPLHIDYPMLLESVTRVVPPPGLAVAVPQRKSTETAFGGWTQSFEQEGRDLLVSLRYQHRAGTYEAGRIGDFEDLLDSALEAGSTQIDLRRAP